MSTEIEVKISDADLSCGDTTTVYIEVIYEDGYIGSELQKIFVSYESIGNRNIDYVVHTNEDSTYKKIDLDYEGKAYFTIHNTNKQNLDILLKLNIENSYNIPLKSEPETITLKECSSFLQKKKKLCFDPITYRSI